MTKKDKLEILELLALAQASAKPATVDRWGNGSADGMDAIANPLGFMGKTAKHKDGQGNLYYAYNPSLLTSGLKCAFKDASGRTVFGKTLATTDKGTMVLSYDGKVIMVDDPSALLINKQELTPAEVMSQMLGAFAEQTWAKTAKYAKKKR